MDPSLCKLTRVFPPAAEDALVELLLASEPPLPGFTSWTADGHGMGFDNSSQGEKVRGRVRRCVLTLIAAHARNRALLDEIAARLAIPRLLYWIEPVLEVGRLIEADAAPARPGEPAQDLPLAAPPERTPDADAGSDRHPGQQGGSRT